MLTDQQCNALRTAFVEHDYTVDAVVEAIGEEAHRALGRNSTVAAVRKLGNRHDPLAVLTLLWPLQRAVPHSQLARAVPGLVEPLLAAGLLRASADEIRATVDIRPYASDDGASGWIVSDLSPNLDTTIAPIRPDFVLGVSSASTTLAQLTVRRPVHTALDLGAGCGVQTLHLARHAHQVVATDLNPRALALADLTLRLNQIEADLRLGNLYEPVAAEMFDLIISNPPYVISPPRSAAERLVYREGELPADGLVQQVVRQGAGRLAEDGVLQVLGNWAHPRAADWKSRLAGWLEDTHCDAHIIQRELLEPGEYIELWLADAGLSGTGEYRQRYLEWIDYFERLAIAGIGMGWIVLQRTEVDHPRIDIEDWPFAVEQPIGPAVGRRLEAVRADRGLSDADLVSARWVLADDVIEESFGSPGAADPARIVHRQQLGFRRAIEVDTALAGILGACDGELTLDQIIGSVAEILELDPSTLRAEVIPRVRQLLVDGFLHSSDDNENVMISG